MLFEYQGVPEGSSGTFHKVSERFRGFQGFMGITGSLKGLQRVSGS